VCPVCSLKIAKGAPGKAGRRDDVAACLAWMNAQDGRLVFFTLTLSHGPHDPLTDLTAAQARAWRRMVQGKVWKELRGPYARTWEATHGENGWHPHYHLTMLMLPYSAREMEQLSKRWQMHQFQPDKPKCHAPDVVAAWLEAYSKHYDIQAAADRIKAEWIRCVKAEGMTASPAGQDVQLVADVEQLSRYHAKSWSLEDEHTNGLAKAGIGKSQWKLLEAAHNGDEKAAALFREFAAATERKRSITYSKGLKAAAKVQDNEDEDLAAAEVEGVVMAMLDAQLWKDAFAADQKVEREFRRMSKRYHDRFGDDIPSDWLEPLLDALGLDYERNGIFYRACRSKPPFESEPEPNQHRVLRQLLAK
jgi:hypothetical protein